MKNSEFSGEIEPTQNYVIADSVVPPLGTPIIESAEYFAWVQYFTKPKLTMTHSPLALENGRHYDVQWRAGFPQEIFTGKRFSVGETQYAVDYSLAAGHVFKPHSQITQEGTESVYAGMARSYHKLKEHNSSSSNALAFICSLDVENASRERLFVSIFTRR